MERRIFKYSPEKLIDIMSYIWNHMERTRKAIDATHEYEECLYNFNGFRYRKQSPGTCLLGPALEKSLMQQQKYYNKLKVILKTKL